MYSDTLNTSNKYVKYRILTYETVVDPPNNRTKVKVVVEAWRTNTGYTTYGSGTCYVGINGTNYSQAITASQKITYNSYTELFTWEDWIYHNPDGSKTIYVSAYISHDSFSSSSQGYNVTLTKYDRQATITGAPNFTDEENPTITYSNPAGNAVTQLQACIISADSQNYYAAYRDIPKTGTSYTFNLTEEERNLLRYATINSPTLAVKFYVRTVIGSSVYHSNKEKILTITNADPVLNPEAVDTGGYSVPLTGNANKIIKGFNYVNVKMNAEPQKGASIKTQRISCGDQIINGASGGFSNVETGKITFSATDSRNYPTTKEVNLEVIPYIKLTCNLAVDNPTTDGKTNVKISGNYWAGNFGAQVNTLEVYFRYKENDGEYSDWIAATASAANDKYTAEIPITGLDYKKAYTFQAKAIDKVITLETAEKKVKATPVYDWGENDFAFNVDVYDKFSQLINNGLAEYEDGNIDANETLSHLCLAQYNTPNNSLYYVMTLFYGTKSLTTNRTQVAIPYIYDITQDKKVIFVRQYVNGEWTEWGTNEENKDLIRVVLSSNKTMSNTAYTVIPFNHIAEEIKKNNSFSFNASTGAITIINENIKKVRVYVSVLDSAWGSDTMYLRLLKNGNVVKRVFLKGQSNIHLETEISVKKNDVITADFYCSVAKTLPSDWEYTQMIVSVS